jgi:predicted NBD/HSP70 family sugar kinase
LSKPNTNNTTCGETNSFAALDLMPRARGTDAKAVAALETSARFLDLGSATVVNLINPDSIYLPGEITTAWDLIEKAVRRSMTKRISTGPVASVPVLLITTTQYPTRYEAPRR